MGVDSRKGWPVESSGSGGDEEDGNRKKKLIK